VLPDFVARSGREDLGTGKGHKEKKGIEVEGRKRGKDGGEGKGQGSIPALLFAISSPGCD